MVYRVRYRMANSGNESEFTVEANSPNEALVKFRHIHQGGAHLSAPESVISVCVAEHVEHLPAHSRRC